MNPNCYHLNLLTKCAIERAREKCKEGHKDEARDWYRFIFQSDIVGILKRNGWPVQLLNDEMKLLNDECHPLNEVMLKGELARIADSLDVLKNFIMPKPARRGGPLELAELIDWK
jgi:hypothetical protein